LKVLRSKLQRIYLDLSSSAIAIKAKTQLTALAHLEDPFFVIGVPGSLHVVERCLRFISESQNIIFIANGLTDWENRWAQSNLKVNGMISFASMLKHGAVLDFLISKSKKHFGILDYDCFVFDPTLFAQIKLLKPETIVNAAFGHKNQALDLEFPGTFFMFFNQQILNMIKQKFHVTSLP